MARTLRDLFLESTIGTSGQPIMDSLTKRSGILMTMPIIEANHKFFHNYIKSGSLPSGTIRPINGSIIPSYINNTAGKCDLMDFSILQQDDESLVYHLGGGRSAQAVIQYFEERYPQYLEGMLQTISKQTIYGTNSTFGNDQGWAGLHQYAKAASLVRQVGGTPGARSTIFVVRWNPAYSAGLLDPAVMDGTSEFMVSNNPTRMMKITNVTTGAQQPVWSSDHHSNMGLMIADTGIVSAISQIDSTHKPTVAYMTEALQRVHSIRDTANTFIYCCERDYGYLMDLKDAKIQTTAETKDYNLLMDFFNNSRIEVDENLLITETAVLD